jgi:hypothetical protein
MTTGAIRAFLLVVGVALGALLIANGFPGGAVPGPGVSTSSPSSGPSPSPTKTKHHLQCPSPHGIRVAIENATSTAGLAAKTVSRLKPAGYTINVSTDIGNASTNSSTTAIYYRAPADKIAAICMKKKFFKIATVQKMPAGGLGAAPPVAPAVQIAVFLGSDYAAAHPV